MIRPCVDLDRGKRPKTGVDFSSWIVRDPKPEAGATPHVTLLSVFAPCCDRVVLVITANGSCLNSDEGTRWFIGDLAERVRGECWGPVLPVTATVRGTEVTCLSDGSFEIGVSCRPTKRVRARTRKECTDLCDDIEVLCRHAGPEVCAEMTAHWGGVFTK